MVSFSLSSSNVLNINKKNTQQQQDKRGVSEYLKMWARKRKGRREGEEGHPKLYLCMCMQKGQKPPPSLIGFT